MSGRNILLYINSSCNNGRMGAKEKSIHFLSQYRRWTRAREQILKRCHLSRHRPTLQRNGTLRTEWVRKVKRLKTWGLWIKSRPAVISVGDFTAWRFYIKVPNLLLYVNYCEKKTWLLSWNVHKSKKDWWEQPCRVQSLGFKLPLKVQEDINTDQMKCVYEFFIVRYIIYKIIRC